MQSLRQLELPYNNSGEVDWNTLGKILSAHILGEVLCASYVDYKYGRRSKEFQADTDWQFYYEERGIIVLKKIQKDSPINVFMGRGVIDLPIEEVVAFLENHGRRSEWDKYLVEIKELKQISGTDVILHMLLEAKQCLVKQQRELLLYERMKYIDGKYVRTSLSIDLPEFPPNGRIPRAEVRPGTGFVCEPFEGRKDKTLVTFVVHIDLTGVPVVIINQVMKRMPMCVYRIREVLTGSRKPNKKAGTTKKNSRHSETLQASGASLTSNHNMEYSLAYGEEVPVSDFLAKSPNIARHQRHSSVPVDVHEAGSWSDDSFRHYQLSDVSTDEVKNALGEVQKSDVTSIIDAQQVPHQQTDDINQSLSECNGNQS